MNHSEKFLMTGLALLLFSSTAFGQRHTFYDAVRTAQLLEEAYMNDSTLRNDSLLHYLSFYSGQELKDLEAAKIAFRNTGNAYIFQLIRGLRQVKNDKLGKESADLHFADPQSGMIGSMALFPPTQTIDAIAGFIAKRFKEELNLAFLNQFRRFLDENERLKIFLPSTWKVLRLTDPYDYPSFLITLQEAVRDDLNRLDQNAIAMLRLEEKTLAKNDPDAWIAFRFMLDAMEGAQNGMHPADILEQAGFNTASLVNSPASHALKLAATISRNLRNRDNPNRGWIPVPDLVMISRPHVAQVFTGFLFAKERSALSSIEIQRRDFTIFMCTDLLNTGQQVSDLIRKIMTLSAGIEEFRKVTVSANKTSVREFTTADYARFLQDLSGLFESSMELAISLGADPLEIQKLRRAAKIIKLGLALHESVSMKNQGLALTQALELVETLSESFPAYFSSGIHDETSGILMRYGNFMVTFARADSKEEMLAALEAAALPVGSYRIKRESIYNISLNMYGGAFLGKEYFTGDSVSDATRSAPAFGATAPVGIAFSAGFPGKNSRSVHSYSRNYKSDKSLSGWSGSLFFAVIDLGAVFAFRLQDSVSALPDLKWINILAPGAYAMLNIKGTPLSIGGGVQYGPQLRSIAIRDNAGAVAEIQPQAFRFHSMIVVDIPFANIYTRRYKQ